MDDMSMNEEAVAAAAETSPVPVELSPEEQAAMAKALEDQAKADAEAAAEAAEAERLALLEAERLARVAVQTPNAVKLMRQRWSGVNDPAIDAALGGIEPDAYEAARAIFGAEIEDYKRTNRPPKGQVLPGGPMPPAEQPKRRARR
jgi:hypothetical protein